MSKITAYASLSSPAPNDVLPIVDVDNLTMAPSGTTMNITVANLAQGMGMALQATTGLTGYTLVNGTGTILNWTAPNDGAMHRAMFLYIFVVTSNETGGQITYSATSAGNTLITNSNLIAAAQTTGTYKFNPNAVLVYPNTAVTLSQFTALTAGAATFWAEIWGS